MLGRRRGPGLVGAAARTAVVAGTATAASGRVQHRQQQKYAAQDQAAYQEAPSPAPVPHAEPQPDYVAELEKLAQLRDQGILTAAEFDAKKAQILGI